MSNDVQIQVGAQPAPGVVGDFADANPRSSVDAGPGGLVSGPNGVTIGRFAWWNTSRIDADGAPAVVTNNGTGAPTGFVHREQQALITTYLADSSQVIVAGQQMTLMSSGTYWVKNDGTTACLVGQKAFANFADGKVSFAATGATPSTASVTGAITAGTASVTGSISGNVLTVTAVLSGTLVAGGTLSGTGGGGVASGTKIVSQLSGGTVGGVGTYSLNIGNQTVTSTTIAETYGILTVTAVGSGSLGVGDTISGSGVTSGTTITQLGTGLGGTGTYIVDPTQSAGSTTITASLAIETKYIAMSAGLAGEIVKISSHVLG